MFKKNFKSIFLIFLISGTIIACSSSSWLLTWLGLEINLMSVIPLILFKLNFNSTESAIKYFIPQAMASITLILISTFDLIKSMSFTQLTMSSIIITVLALKSGMAPLHFWFPQIMMFMEWNMCLIMLIWQKIAPFILFSMFKMSNLIIILILSSSVVGAVGGLNQNNIKMILTYSSIIHGAWMLLSTMWSYQLWASYFFIYTLISSSIIMLTVKNKMTDISYLNKAPISKSEKITVIFNTLSLAGLPPFLGFTAKLMIIVKTIKITPMLILFTLIFSSLTSLYYYLKLFFNMLINLGQTEKIQNSPFTHPNPINMIFLSISINMIAPALIFLT